jgi:6-pyruvoyltetrahydropterin/6-carboxytetrahydropterin synthase
MEIFREFTFEAAHELPHVPEGHKCRRLHGHSYRLVVAVEGDIEPESGWVMDFGEIKEQVAPVTSELDHHYLNKIDGLENPTSETLSRWIWDRLSPVLPGLSSVTVRETAATGCVYRGR